MLPNHGVLYTTIISRSNEALFYLIDKFIDFLRSIGACAVHRFVNTPELIRVENIIQFLVESGPPAQTVIEPFLERHSEVAVYHVQTRLPGSREPALQFGQQVEDMVCLLYTSDAADE